MCGIAGIYNTNGIGTDSATVRRMARAIAHRGPDEEGFHVDQFVHLAARRLSIIDLQAGAQPIYNHKKNRCIVFNGEIYNYRSLRRELEAKGYNFETGTDTEVVLKAYNAWGAGCLDRFQGMFAFCIWSSAQRELFLARDRLGIKPLYYCALPDETLVFASEIKSLLQHPQVPRRPYPNAVRNLLTYGFNIAPHTFFDSVKQLLPGHFMRIRPEGTALRQYWDITLDAPAVEGDEREVAARFRERLERAVSRSLVSDVPVATYLSGGIDSSAVTGLYASLSDRPVTSLTITFDSAAYDEIAFSRAVAGRFATENIEFRCGIVPDDIERLVYHLENPLVSLLNLPLFLLSRKTREQGIKVVLTGDGADEVLGGYDYTRLLKAMAFIEKTGGGCRKQILRALYPHIRGSVAAEAQYVNLCGARDHYAVEHPAVPYWANYFPLQQQLFAPGFREQLDFSAPDNPFFFHPVKCEHRSLVDQALYIDMKMRLLNLTLPLSDKMSMANSVEVRPLFLDHELVDFCFRIPWQYKLRGMNEKNILKKSMQGFLPDEVCARRKQPLQPPGDWFLGIAGQLVTQYLSPECLAEFGYFSPAFVGFLLAEYRSGRRRDFAGILVVLLFVQLWHDIYIKRSVAVGGG